MASFRNYLTFDDLNSCKVFWQSNTEVDVHKIISYTQNVLQIEAEQRKNKEQRRRRRRRRKFLSHSKPGSRTEKAVKFGVRNVWCARTDKSCASGAPGNKTCGHQIEGSYRHLSSTTLTTKMRSESVNRKPSESVNQQKGVVKLVKQNFESAKQAPNMFLLTRAIPTSRGPRWCFGEG